MGSLTRKEVEYLKAVFDLTSNRDLASSLDIANNLGVSCATASETLKRLSEKGLVIREPWKGVRLSELGFKEINKIVRNHRVFETYAHKVLLVSLNEACECARRIEMYLSEEIVNSMCRILGHPKKCPHNKDIPRGIPCCVRE
ncbi:MAG: metal-dependent transcriptional regulator [Candidatus Bathyarchaeia archaeon]|nr:metal-dependent transcriptional regulator [Candidatus Bathyarchaeota archaeon]